MSLIHFTRYGVLLALQTSAPVSPDIRLIRLLADITDAKQKLRRTLQCANLQNVTVAGLDKEESQDSYYGFWHIFIETVGSNCNTNFNSCPNKKVSLGISVAFVNHWLG